MEKGTNTSELGLLKLALYGVLIFVLLTVIFALLTQSNTILFDGIYSLISFCMIILTIQVAKLAERPNDDHFHFGYTRIEPTLNLFKSLFVIAICIFAITEAVQQLLAGGNRAEYGLGAFYGFLSASGCFVIAYILRRGSRSSSSDLLRVEANTWLVDGLISSSIFLGFVCGWILEQSEWEQYAQLIDPVLLITIVLIALPVPGKVVFDSVREIISMAPADNIVHDIETVVRDQLRSFDVNEIVCRVSKQGRSTYALVHVIVSNDFGSAAISKLDNIRDVTSEALCNFNTNIKMDMIFVQDKKFAV